MTFIWYLKIADLLAISAVVPVSYWLLVTLVYKGYGF